MDFSLWNFAMIVVGAFLLNSIFYFIPYLMPRINAMELLTYQAFANGMILLIMILPRGMWEGKDSKQNTSTTATSTNAVTT